MARPGSKATKQEWIDYADELGADLEAGATSLEEATTGLERAATDAAELGARIDELEELSRASTPAATLAATPAGITTSDKPRAEWGRGDWRHLAEQLEADNAVLRDAVGSGEGDGVAVYRRVRTESAERYQRIQALTDQLTIARDKLAKLGVL